MCFIIETPKQIATEDIIVYKFMRKDLCSYIQDFSYKLNILYKTTFSYKGLKYNLLYPWPRISRDEIYRGFHSYATIKKCLWHKPGFRGIYVYECIIPKGSVYYRNECKQEIVSNQIIIKGANIYVSED